MVAKKLAFLAYWVANPLAAFDAQKSISTKCPNLHKALSQSRCLRRQEERSG
ncbi:MAG: hypothetical protein K2P98_03855 [Neisseriaceae bacterium]|nr:hypothetical protein [Neisseriaceae bacterium]